MADQERKQETDLTVDALANVVALGVSSRATVRRDPVTTASGAVDLQVTDAVGRTFIIRVFEK